MSFIPCPEITAVVFDFDGTLALPVLDFSLLKNNVLEALSQFGPLPQNTAIPVLELIDQVCQNLSDEQILSVRKTTEQVITALEVEAASRSALFSFVRPMLHSLREQGIRTGVITRNCPEAIYAVFPDILERMDCLFTRYDVEQVKPHPEHLERALQNLEVEAVSTLMIGDHPMDIAVGKAVGTLTGAVESGEASRELLEAACPSFIAKDAGILLHQLSLFSLPD